ncbi:MAG TPA: nitric-oxide reductase large subunit [Fibrobacteria bacterium]|nr:nitric-oxide reductase large subunit [Fibrobacteria bacterium]
MRDRRGWGILAIVTALSFAVLLWGGHEIWRQAPPVPEKVVDSQGNVLFTGDQIRDGQNVWQSTGGQELGSIWGHGAYVAPDWSADRLHREAVAMAAAGASPEEVRRILRDNGYDAATKTLVLPKERADAAIEVGRHYRDLFGGGPVTRELRSYYAMRDTSVYDPARLQALDAFLFWATWACAAERPGSDVSYSNNWPHEPLAGNVPSSAILLWSMASILVLLIGIALLVWWHARANSEEPHVVPATDPFLGLRLTASMRASLLYFAVVSLLMVVQVALGGVVAHYGVEGSGFYGLNLDDILPYGVGRTWHVQLGIFWIATSWLATGLFLAPAVGGREPKGQALGVHVLLGALVVVVFGSMAGEWLGVMQKLGLGVNFWFGHQGYEYVDLGRFWQILLFGGLLFWFFLVLRGLAPAFRQGSDGKSLLWLFTLSAGAIGMFYGAGLMWGRHTHLALAEYWRWWVVHLWVEGFFEVFATAAIGFLFARLGLIRASTAGRAAVTATAVFLGGGIIGTFHHLYFSGTPVSILALGSVFSALEIVPLTLVGFEAVATLRHMEIPWMRRWKWPVMFFLAVSFWNFVGAGLFGFLINPPIALYYMQGLNLTPVHGHTALFGVYGFLGLAFVLFCLRAAWPGELPERPLRWSFWGLNIGLSLMVVLSLLPIGILQTAESIDTGLWSARSAEFLNTSGMQTLKWMRVPGDVVFGTALLLLAVVFTTFVIRILSRKEQP